MNDTVHLAMVEMDYGNNSHGHLCCFCGEPLPTIPAGEFDSRFPYRAVMFGLPVGTGQRGLHVDVTYPTVYGERLYGARVCSEGCAIAYIAWAADEAKVVGKPFSAALCPIHYPRIVPNA